jgi:hypothetical protein
MEAVRKLYRSAQRYQRIILVLVLLLAAVLGVCLILVGDNYSLGLLRDLGIGLLVSVFVSVTIELYASSTLRLAVTAEITEAIFKRLIPESIWQQVATFVLRARFTTPGLFEIDIEIPSPRDDADAAALQTKYGTGVHLIHYTARWKVENITGASETYRPGATIDADLYIAELGVPRFARIDVLGKDSERNVHLISADRNAVDGAHAQPNTDFVDLHTLCELMASTEVTAAKSLDHVNLTYTHNVGLGFSLKTPRRIPARETIEISYEAWRGVRSPGVFVYTVGIPADGIRVRIPPRDDMVFRVSALHPDPGGMTRPTRDEWRLDRGILPGQGVQIYFAPKHGEQVGLVSQDSSVDLTGQQQPGVEATPQVAAGN